MSLLFTGAERIGEEQRPFPGLSGCGTDGALRGPVFNSALASRPVVSKTLRIQVNPWEILERVRAALGSVIRGKEGVVDGLLVGILGAGHVLIEDVPGVGKTTLVKTLARVFDLQFTRVQFTADLLPTDLLGGQVLRPQDGSLEFVPGPVFTEVLLADEINRASPRTQSALLEAMSEGQVTTDGVTRALPQPFLVLATQNPSEFQGTFPLPEAQLDRFLVRMRMGYPNPEDELSLLISRQNADPLDLIRPVADAQTLLGLQRATRNVVVQEPVARYLLSLVSATRRHPEVELGVSPRGSLALFRAAQAQALLRGRTWVGPDDVQQVVPWVLGHRLVLSATARHSGVRAEDVLASLVASLAVPS